MLDLFHRQNKALKYVLTAMLVVIGLSMVVTLIPGFGTTTNTSADDNTLATVCDAKITSQDVERALQAYVKAGNIPQELMQVYAGQFVDKMVLERAAVCQFQRMGLTVSDDEVRIGMMSQFSQFFQNGELISQAQLEQALAAQGVTLQDTIDAMRYQLLLRKVQNMLLATAVVTPKEVDEELKRSHEKAKVSYIAFPPFKFQDEVKPTPEEMKAYFEAHRAQYPVPEKHSFQVLVVDQDKVEAGLQVSDAQLRAAYSANLDNFRMPERVKARHILIKTTDKSDAEKKTLLAKARDVLKQVKAGGDFAELAKKYSDDGGTAQKGGELDWVVRGQLGAPEFEKAIFSLKPKEVSNVVTTEYGYHIIQVMEKEDARVKPFDEVKAGLAADLKKQGVTDKMQMLGDEAQKMLAKAPGSAADIAKQLGIDVITVNGAKNGDVIPTLGASPEIENSLLTMKKNDVSQVISLPSNRLAVVVLTDRIPARAAEFADVQDQVREAVIADRSQVIAADRAKDAANRIRAGEDMAKVAKSMKLEVTESSEFGRADSVEGLGAAVQVGDAFTKPVGTVVGPLVIQNRNVVYKIDDRKDADPVTMQAERPAVLEQLKHKKAVATNELFMDSVRAKLEKDGKVKVNRDAIKRLTASLAR